MFKLAVDNAGVHEKDQKWHQREKELHAALQQAQDVVHAALLDNFDTPKALATLFELVKTTNIYLEESLKDNTTR